MTTPDIIATLRQWSEDFQQKHGQLPPCWLVDAGEYGAAVRWFEDKTGFPSESIEDRVTRLDGLPFRIVSSGATLRVDALLPYIERTVKIVLKLPHRQRNALVRAACSRNMKLSAFMLEAAFAAAGEPQDVRCVHDWVDWPHARFCRLCQAFELR